MVEFVEHPLALVLLAGRRTGQLVAVGEVLADCGPGCRPSSLWRRPNPGLDGLATGSGTGVGYEPGGSWRSGGGRRGAARVAWVLAALSAVPIVAGCAAPSTGYGDYRGKVHETAVAMISAVATGQLAAGLLVAGKSTGAFADATVTDAEKDADSIQTALDSRQPPDSRSLALKNQADQAVQSAVSGLADLRIAVRRNDMKGIREAQAELARALPQLERFAS